MNAIALRPFDLALTAGLVLLDAAISLALRLGLHRQLLWAAARMTVQLIAVGFILRAVFALQNPLATFAIVAVMALVAAREIAARPERRFRHGVGLALSAGAVVIATTTTIAVALATAIRSHPWYDPRYAISLAGIILGSVLNAGSLALDSLLDAVGRERGAIEARLALGESFSTALAPLVRDAVRRGLLPIINQMSAAGVVTLPGIMTGQILAGLDPMDAVKYQILLMFLLAGASGLAAVSVTLGAARRLTDPRQRLRLDRLS